jgi:hypothetical protein
VLTADEAARVLDLLRRDAIQTYDTYEHLLNDQGDGTPVDPTRAPWLARELARMNLTLNTYTQWYWKIDLHNLLHFLSAARRRPRPVRDPRLRRRDRRPGEGVGARTPGRPSTTTASCGTRRATGP